MSKKTLLSPELQTLKVPQKGKTSTDLLNLVGGIDISYENDMPHYNEPGKKHFPRGLRITLIVNELLYDKLKAIAYWSRKSTQDVFVSGLEKLVAEYELEHGSLQLPEVPEDYYWPSENK